MLSGFLYAGQCGGASFLFAFSTVLTNVPTREIAPVVMQNTAPARPSVDVALENHDVDAGHHRAIVRHRTCPPHALSHDRSFGMGANFSHIPHPSDGRSPTRRHRASRDARAQNVREKARRRSRSRSTSIAMRVETHGERRTTGETDDEPGAVADAIEDARGGARARRSVVPASESRSHDEWQQLPVTSRSRAGLILTRSAPR